MIYVSVGSNLGNRLENIKKAIELLKKEAFSSLVVMPVLETKALITSNAPIEWDKPFLNTIIYGHSDLSPENLLEKLKEIEVRLGRPKLYKKWQPRVIDLDILLWDDLCMNTDSLIIPHPELCNRHFLIHMIALISPMLKYPNVENHKFRNKTFGEIALSFPNIVECYNKILTISPQLVGVVNITHDSFSDGGRYLKYDKAIEHALQLSSDGASIIELGAQSTRPGAKVISQEEEYDRLLPVLDGLLEKMKDGTVKVSLDTFNDEVIQRMLEYYPISWINDVKGSFSDKTLIEIANKGCKIVVMHSLSVPVQKGEYLSAEKHINNYVDKWVKQVTEKLERCGFRKDSIIIDPGIGFGKSPYQNLVLIRQAKRLKNFGYQILFGHSRKSYIASFSKSVAFERDIETIAISNYLSDCEVDYLRVHNVRNHQRFFVAKQLMEGH